jgi:hypothetical protein
LQCLAGNVVIGVMRSLDMRSIAGPRILISSPAFVGVSWM